MTAGAGRRSRSRSPAPCGCCGDPEGDGARRRRRRTQGRRTVSCGCPPDDAADDGEGGSRRYWTGSPPRTPPDWRDSFQQLRRRWSDEARRRSRRRGSQDRARPANPSPGEIRAMSGRNRPGAQPEYAASGPDPAPWTPEAQAASQPTLQQRLAELQRWQEATLRVSVEAVEPTSGSHFSLAACWDPDSSPNTLISSTGTNPPPRRDTARTSAIGASPVVEPAVSSSTTSSSSGSSVGEDGSSTEESDSEDQTEDPLEEVWDEVDEVLQEHPIDKDEARAEVESILRASVLTKGEKLSVINAALEESAKDPEERRETAKSMLRRSTRSARELSDTDDAEREASYSQIRRSTERRRTSRGSRVRSLVEEFEAEPRVSVSTRRSTKGTLRARKSTRIAEDAEDRPPKSVKWSRRSTALVPLDSRKSSFRASAIGTEESARKSQQRQSLAPRKTGMSEKLGSVFGKSVSTAPKSVYYEAHLAPRPSQRRTTRRSSPWRVNSSVLREKRSSATGGAFEVDEETASRSTRATERWSIEGRHGSRGSILESHESEDDVGTSPRHSARRSTARKSSKVPRESHHRRSTAASHEDDELLPTRSLSTRKPTGWARHSSSADTDADEWATPRHSAEGSFRSATDDKQRHSHRKSSRRSTHKEPVDARESRRGTGFVSDIEEYSSEEETRKSSSRTSIVEEGDPAERHRWSSRRRDDEDDEGGGAGASVASHRHSGRKGSARRSTYADHDHAPHPRKKSHGNGMYDRGAEAHCCCVAGDHASCPFLRPSAESKKCTCAPSAQLASASDFCCCRSKAEREGVSRAGMGDGSSSEECCCHSCNALATVSREECEGECSCYCDDVCGSAPELCHVCEDDVTANREKRGKSASRKGGIKKRDLEVELCCECLGENAAPPANEGDTCREVCPAAKPCDPTPCKAALEDWTEPSCLCERSPPKKKNKKTSPAKSAPAVRPRPWRRLLLRYAPCLAAVVLWLACVWWLCGMLRPLFSPDHCRSKRCGYWAP